MEQPAGAVACAQLEYPAAGLRAVATFSALQCNLGERVRGSVLCTCSNRLM
jgi:hypothetical protein